MNLEGKTVKTVKLIPTIETALLSNQDVEEIVIEFDDGTLFAISVADIMQEERNPDADHLKIKFKEGKLPAPETPEVSECTTKKRRGILGWRFSKT